jgi:hypothetical protein
VQLFDLPQSRSNVRTSAKDVDLGYAVAESVFERVAIRERQIIVSSTVRYARNPPRYFHREEFILDIFVRARGM